MKQLNIAKRYARALAETAAKNARTEETSRQFSDFLQLWNESANMRELLLNPVFDQLRDLPRFQKILATEYKTKYQ